VSVASHVLSALNQYFKLDVFKFGSLAVTFMVSICTGHAIVQLFIVHVGASLSIRFTVAKFSHVFHASSANSNKNVQFTVKLCVVHPTLFIVIFSLSHVNVAITSVFVSELGLYETDAVGFVISIFRSCELANVVLFHALSSP